MQYLSDLANTIDYSEIIHLESYVQQQIAKGKTVCDLIIGDFDTKQFPMPKYLTEQIQQAYTNNHNDYPPLEGVLPLRKQIAKLTQQTSSVSYDPDIEILIASGARPLLYTAMLALVSAGEPVIYPVPSWNNMFYTDLCHGEHLPIETTAENNFLPTAQQISKHIKRARLITLCSPQNPNGTMFTKDELIAISELIVTENKRRESIGEKPVYLIYDQVYWLLTMQNSAHYLPSALCPDIKDYLIVVDAGSKAFAATGIRVGWAMGPKAIIAKMQVLLEHIGSMAPTAEQLAMSVLLEHNHYVQDYLSTFKRKIMTSIQVLHDGIQQMKQAGLPIDSVLPMAGIYISLKIDILHMLLPNGQTFSNSDDISRFLIDAAGLAIVPFSSFGCTSVESQSWFRAAVCAISPMDIQAALPRLQKALLSLSCVPQRLEA